MKVELTYSEVESYLKNNHGHEVSLSYVAPSTVRVETNVKVAFVTKHVEMDVNLDKIVGNDLFLSYVFSSWAMEKVFNGAFSIFNSTISNKLPMVEKFDGNNLIVHLDNISQLREALKLVEIENIEFKADGILMILKLKS